MAMSSQYSLIADAEKVSVVLSCRGVLPDAGKEISVPEAPVMCGTVFTVKSGRSQWRIAASWEHRLGELYIAVRAAVSRFSKAAVRKYKTYYNMVKTVLRPTVPQFLRL